MYQHTKNKEAIVGTLMRIEEDPNSRYHYEIWFDYTREIINTISEGAMAVVPNFYIDNERKEWMSVLEISTILPVHYAIPENQSGYPGFLTVAAESAGKDWIEQESQSTDHTTKIRCVAIPTNLMIDDGGNLQEEENIPMVGHPARILNTETTSKIVNHGIGDEEDTIVAGTLIRDKNVNVRLRVEDTLRTHFAVFGFTGAGKSNFLSTLISNMLSRPKDKSPVKIVVFDLMGEFSVLLSDLLDKLPHAKLLGIGRKSFPESVTKYYCGKDELEKAATHLARTSLYPKRLKSKVNSYISLMKKLLEDKKIRIWEAGAKSIGEFVKEHKSTILKGSLGNDKPIISKVINDIEKNEEDFRQLKEVLQKLEDMPIKNNTGISNREEFISLLKGENERVKDLFSIPELARAKIPDIIKRLNDPNSSSLIVVQSANPDELRNFAETLGDLLYENRRQSGQISPMVSFIFDEADEFIPQNPEKDSSYAHSSAIAMTLARRGRKFGLGIGIATQRVTYLNTSIMAQPHTYFVSKLPRKSDRDKICEAFGISEEMFRQTFKFRKGNWLVMSHEATGLESVPLPIKSDNADERILEWLNEKFPDKGER